ncbi:hypothetical protein BKG93_06665 [Rodentibacter ratti]|uniref:Uncharacterized protein n=1 Tax=Rodentibacter ratti TaxID=1906745 RepID=A0A1V3L4A9_9PAST|nr:hypothetical protein [Rodentibacter ratti]OOF84641.1 hypothetical protein BKG93_06665 [Rodentibacter ratti]
MSKFAKELKKRLADFKAGQGKVARVGVIENQHYDDDTPVAYIAAVHEYGAVISVPERKATIHRKINKKGEWTNKYGSRFVKKSQSNFDTDVTIPAHTIKIEARPFFRPTIREKSQEWGRLASSLLKQDLDLNSVLYQIGDRASKDVVETISKIKEPKLKKSTIRARKSRYKSKVTGELDKPLVDTGQLIGAISSQVVDKSGE